MQVVIRIDVIQCRLTGGENYQVVVRLERAVWEWPLIQLVGIIAEIPSAEFDVVIGWVMNLDPVRRVSVTIQKAFVIRRHEFRDQQRCRRQEVSRFE